MHHRASFFFDEKKKRNEIRKLPMILPVEKRKRKRGREREIEIEKHAFFQLFFSL